MAVLVPAVRGIRIPEFVRRRAEIDAELTRTLASAILPSELGADGARRAADAFVAWAGGYRAGAELSHGYGSARIRTAGPDPSIRWSLQLHSLDDDARKAHGRGFAALSDDERRTIVRTQVGSERAPSLSNVAGAQHVAVALLAHFYDSPDATDLCYEARISKTTCRPLAESSNVPVPLRRAGARRDLPGQGS
jgi:hypothetical protein